MGAMKNIKLEKRDASRRRTTTKARKQADWGEADSGLLAQAVVYVTRDDGAIQFGYSRDGGAYAVRIYENGVGESEYIPPNEDINEYLRGVIEDFRP